MTERPSFDVAFAALEAIKRVRQEYGIPCEKPCVAYLLDQGASNGARHDEAFVLALELRRLGVDAEQTERALNKWAVKRGCPRRYVRAAVRSAFRRNPGGGWVYHSPGLTKRPGSRAAE